MRTHRIAILFHENESEKTVTSSLITLFSRFWEEDGYEVIYLFGTEEFIPADLLFVHVDMSVVPDSYLEFASQYPVTVNAHIKDIRKSVISSNLLDRNSDWNGPVIVKTDRNCGGFPERIRNGVIGKVQTKLLRSLNHPLIHTLIISPSSSDEYRVFNRLHDVPLFCFYDPRVIVEKFIPELEGGFYCVRMLSFLGDRMICVRLKSKHPIVKGENTEEIERSVRPHPYIIDMRYRLRFDYGKFDYIEVDGNAILLDANKTIGFSPQLDESRVFNQSRRYRAEGLYSFFEP